jgi:hypothetical protein
MVDGNIQLNTGIGGQKLDAEEVVQETGTVVEQQRVQVVGADISAVVTLLAEIRDLLMDVNEKLDSMSS